MPVNLNAETMSNSKVTLSASPEEKGRNIITWLANEDLKWMQFGGGATESQTWYISFSDGSFVFLQTAYAALGLSPTVQCQIRYTSKDLNVGKSKSYSGSSMVLSKDKCSFFIDECNSTKMITKEDGISYDVRYSISNDFSFEFQFQSSFKPCQINKGKSLLGVEGKVGYVYHRFVPFGLINGFMRLPSGEMKEIKGSAVLVHALQSAKPHLTASKWDFFVLLNNEKSSCVVFCQFITPSALDSCSVSFGYYVENGKMKLLTTKADIDYSEEEVNDSSGYSFPHSKNVVLEGEDMDGFDIEVVASVSAENMFERVDILADLPFLVRKVVQAFVAKPFCFMWYDSADIEIKRGGNLLSKSSCCAYHEITFINM